MVHGNIDTVSLERKGHNHIATYTVTHQSL